MTNFKTNTKNYLSFIFNKFSFLKVVCLYVFDKFANISICVSKGVGNLYTLFFNYLGTSWYDHRYDQLRGVRNYHWTERAFFVLPKISEKDYILDIGCGDGIYSGEFYSGKAKKILAIDKNKSAIEHAIKHYGKQNVKFMKKNVLKWRIPVNKFNSVIMFSVIEHFTKSEGFLVLRKVKKSLKPGGSFFGSTPLIDKVGQSNWEHKNEFTSEIQLRYFLKKVFNEVKISKSLWSRERPECYFECKP
jgi:2-polyprenyl-3-methyl-5-hydroxy-6-metoxy-1,4-benzoquinol methylase